MQMLFFDIFVNGFMVEKLIKLDLKRMFVILWQMLLVGKIKFDIIFIVWSVVDVFEKFFIVQLICFKKFFIIVNLNRSIISILVVRVENDVLKNVVIVKSIIVINLNKSYFKIICDIGCLIENFNVLLIVYMLKNIVVEYKFIKIKVFEYFVNIYFYCGIG